VARGRPASAPVARPPCSPSHGLAGVRGWCRPVGRHPPVGKKGGDRPLPGGDRPMQGGDRPPRRSLGLLAHQVLDHQGRGAGADLSAGTHQRAGSRQDPILVGVGPGSWSARGLDQGGDRGSWSFSFLIRYFWTMGLQVLVSPGIALLTAWPLVPLMLNMAEWPLSGRAERGVEGTGGPGDLTWWIT
jgi:hypothetical protein